MNNRWFATTNVILFLNKKDLFDTKVKRVPLTVCFPEYQGPQEYRECIDFVRDKFSNTNKSAANSRFIYHHETCAVRRVFLWQIGKFAQLPLQTDTNNIRVVFEAVADIFLTANLKLVFVSNLSITNLAAQGGGIWRALNASKERNKQMKKKTSSTNAHL